MHQPAPITPAFAAHLGRILPVVTALLTVAAIMISILSVVAPLLGRDPSAPLSALGLGWLAEPPDAPAEAPTQPPAPAETTPEPTAPGQDDTGAPHPDAPRMTSGEETA